VHAPEEAEAQFAQRAAQSVQRYWPSLQFSTQPRAHKAQGGGRSGLDILWIERWGGSRRSAVLYQGAKQGELPSDRAIFRALSEKIYGGRVLQNL
jgi:hypothetical protein